jgi:hypothetical protein
LLVAGDFFVEQTVGTALLLYRLLTDYPRDRLIVVYNSASPHPHSPAKGLPDVEYAGVDCAVPLWARNRPYPFWPLVLAPGIRRAETAILERLERFAPQAVLTVPYDFMWLSAAAIARDRRLPLHLILHDDWPSKVTWNQPGAIGAAKRWFCRPLMGRVYRQAASRLCVSPGMEERYRRWFGLPGEVLYPSRGTDSPEPRIRVSPACDRAPTVAYCGLVHHSGTSILLAELAAILGRLEGFLDLYTPQSQPRGNQVSV